MLDDHRSLKNVLLYVVQRGNLL